MTVLVVGGAGIAGACSTEPSSTREGARRAPLTKQELLNPAAEPEFGVGIVGTPQGKTIVPQSALQPAKWAATGEQHAAAVAAKPPLPSSSPNPAAPSQKAEIVAKAAGLPPSTPVAVALTLADPAFLWRALRDPALTASDRQWILDVRKEQVAPVTGPVKQKLLSVGATDVGETWIAAALTAVVPAGQIATIASWPEVVHLAEQTPFQPATGYGADEARNGMRLSTFVSNGYNGSQGGGAGGAVRVGVFDSAQMCTAPDKRSLFTTHNGFQRCVARCSTSFAQVYDCDTSTCVTASYPQNEKNCVTNCWDGPHGQHVSRVLMGSIESGQDPAFPGTGTPAQRTRSGIVPDGAADTYFFDNRVTAAIPVMLQFALGAQIDVVNYSGGPGSCSRTYDEGGARNAITNATDAGILMVASMGNEQHGGNACTARFPATHRDVLAAGALLTNPPTQNYDTAAMGFYTSRGGMDVVRWDGAALAKAFAVADLAAPGSWAYWYRNPDPERCGPNPPTTGSYDPMSGDTGDNAFTSYAAPSVSGSIVLLKHAWSVNFGSPPTGRFLLTHMLLMGDGWRHDCGCDLDRFFDQVSGAGRVHMHYPAFANLGANWAWYTFVANVANQQYVSYWLNNGQPLPATVNHVKVAMLTLEPDNTYGSVADVDLYLNTYDAPCTGPPSGGGSDVSVDNRSRIEATNVAGKCAEIRLYGYSVPPGGRTVYVGSYYHSGNPADH